MVYIHGGMRVVDGWDCHRDFLDSLFSFRYKGVVDLGDQIWFRPFGIDVAEVVLDFGSDIVVVTQGWLVKWGLGISLWSY